MSRPAVDVVVPFAGDDAALRDLRGRLEHLRLDGLDTLTVVDNTPGVPRDGTIHAPRIPTPAYARNRGGAEGSAPWVVFLDSDTAPAHDLLDRYFDPMPGDRTGLLAGGVDDEPVPRGGPAVARYAYLHRRMSQDRTFGLGEWSFAQSANVACRRDALDAVGGFREDIRAGEDADLTYRLRAAGWEVERRERASVVHHSRQTVREFVGQMLHHGAGSRWLEDHHPGSSPGHRRPGLLFWGVRHTATELVRAARGRERDRALCAPFEALELIAREFGRSMSNDVPRAGP